MSAADDAVQAALAAILAESAKTQALFRSSLAQQTSAVLANFTNPRNEREARRWAVVMDNIDAGKPWVKEMIKAFMDHIQTVDKHGAESYDQADEQLADTIRRIVEEKKETETIISALKVIVSKNDKLGKRKENMNGTGRLFCTFCRMNNHNEENCYAKKRSMFFPSPYGFASSAIPSFSTPNVVYPVASSPAATVSISTPSPNVASSPSSSFVHMQPRVPCSYCCGINHREMNCFMNPQSRAYRVRERKEGKEREEKEKKRRREERDERERWKGKRPWTVNDDSKCKRPMVAIAQRR